MSSTAIKFPYSRKPTVNYGNLDDLILGILIQTPNGLSPAEFVFDTGADVSMLPKYWIKLLGLNQEELKCHWMTGVSEEEIVVYKGNLKIKLAANSKLFEIPVTFSQSDSSPQILGKAGVLNRFTITSDHRTKTVSFVD